MDSLNEMQTDSELRFTRDSSAPSRGDWLDTLVPRDPIEPPTRDSAAEFGVEALAEFKRLQVFLDLVEDPIPTQIGRYQIERVIGRGGMGIVHLAHDPELNRNVALKLVHAGPFTNRERLHARLQREARVLARLTHPNVVGVYDVGTHEGELFVAMEHVPGTNLRIWQESGSRSQGEILGAYLQAARGLAAVHRAGIVHRDFKPDNVLISDDGRVLVGDFGLADDRDLDSDPDAAPEREGFARTQTGALMGTLRYMAPERLSGEAASKASDQFEFCVSLWEALAGRRPFLGEGRADLSASMTSAPQGGAKIDRRIRRVLEQGLAREPEQRHASFDALIDAIEQRDDRARWLGLAGVAAIVAVVIGLGMIEPEPEHCEVADRIAELDEAELTLPDGSSDSARQAVQARFDKMVGELGGVAETMCSQPEQVERLDRWVDVLELVAEHSDELPAVRTLETLAELQFERDREPPELASDEVARLIDEAREHIAMGRLEEAEKVTLKASEAAHEPSDRAEVSLRLGQLAAWRGRPAAALRLFEMAAASADAAGRDRVRLSAHLLATPVAISDAEEPEQAEDHHRRVLPLLKRLDLGEDDPLRIDYDEHEALFAAEREEFDVALAIQERVLDQRIANGDPLTITKSRRQLARIHHLRSYLVTEPGPDRAAADAGYQLVLDELDVLDAAPEHPLRLATQFGLGVLRMTPDLTDAQLDEIEAHMNVIVEQGRSRYYISAIHMLVSVLIQRNENSPSSNLLTEATRLGELLYRELQFDDVAPQVRLETWTVVAQLHALQGNLHAVEDADAMVNELAGAAVDNGTLSPSQRDILLASHTMQLVAVFKQSNPELARRYALRAVELTDRLPAEAKQNPDVASTVGAIAEAAAELAGPTNP